MLTSSYRALWITLSPTIFSVLWSSLQSFKKFCGKHQLGSSEAYLGPYEVSMMEIFNTRIHAFNEKHVCKKHSQAEIRN